MTRQLPIDQPFDLALSLMMGQAFRWRPLGEGWFSGVIGESLVHIRQTDSGVEYWVGGPDGGRDAKDSDDEMLRRYFRDDDDVTAIYASISRDPVVAELVCQYPGIRILRQEPWECLVAYICSARNNIPQISVSVEKIADSFGAEVELDGETRRTFPSPQRIIANPDWFETLTLMKLGLKREKKIAKAAVKVAESELVPDQFRNYRDRDGGVWSERPGC